jgi:phage terminase large subunit GpA-like protein
MNASVNPLCNADAAQALVDDVRATWAPPPHLLISEWADRYRRLSRESSDEPGPWDTARAPYQRAIMDAVCDPLVHAVVVMSSTQVGKTEILCNIIGYMIDLDPSPMLLIQPTLDMAEAFSKDRLMPMLRDCPTLQGKVRVGHKDGTNAVRHKQFPGGHITLVGSNSSAGLSSRPIRIVLADEVDRWEASIGKEGDPLALAEKRMANFWNHKLVVVSTPTTKGISRIEDRYAASDQRQCFVPCPHCSGLHVLAWANVKWTANAADTAHLVCPHCGCEISEAGRQEMLRSPEWRASAPFTGTAGFHVWEAYSPWRRLRDIVADFLKAKTSPDTLQVFINTSLGETWEEKAISDVQPDVLLARREPYAAAVPAGACCLTMGVDVQDDRLEAVVVGWGLGEESWIVDSRTIPGDPQRPEPWAALDERLAATFIHESGAQLAIQATCIDSAGHRTQYVYDYVAKRQHQSVYAIIGRDGSDRAIVSAPSQKRSGRDPRKVALYTIGVDLCKSLIYSRLKLTAPGPGFIHLPLPHQRDNEYVDGVDEEFIAQVASERLVTRREHGIPYRVWIKTRPRNEKLDCLVYAVGALRLARPDLNALAARLHGGSPKPTAPTTPVKPGGWIPRREGSWLHGRRG